MPLPSNQYDAQLLNLERRRAIAQMLREKSMQDDSGQMAGRVYVPASPVQGLARMLSAYASKKRDDKIDAQEQDVQSAKQAEIGRLISSMPQVGQDDTAAVTQLAGLDPRMAGIVSQLRGRKETIAAHSQDLAEQRAAREADLKSRQEFQAQQAEMQRRLQLQLGQLSAGNRQPPKPVAVIGEDGKPIYVDPTQAVGKVPYSGAQASKVVNVFASDDPSDMTMVSVPAQEAADNHYTIVNPQTLAARKAQKGRADVTASLQQMAEHFKALADNNGMPTPGGGLGNVAAYVKGSSVGQGLGHVFGTDNQTTRDLIKQIGPELLTAFKQQTGTGATQMNTEKELEFFKQMIADPTAIRSDTALEKLRQFEKTYGLGKGIGVDVPAAGAPQPGAGANQAPPEAVEMLKKNPALAPHFKAKYGYLPNGV